MGVLNNTIEINKLKKSGGGVSPEIEEELQELSDDIVELTTNLNAITIYDQEETKIGSFFGKNLYRKAFDSIVGGAVPYEGVEHLIDARVVCHHTSGPVLGTNNNGLGIFVQYQKNLNRFYITNSNNYTLDYLIVDYTKNE